jgi:uncharacterized protein (TIGR03067 family)
MCRLLVALLVVPVAALAAPALKDRSPKDASSILGEWERVRRIDAGTDRGPDREPHRQTFMADGAWDYTYGGRPCGIAGMRYLTDPKQAPRTIDIHVLPGKLPSYRGIFQVEGDSLTLCLVEGDGDRPTKFESSADHPTTIWVFQRVRSKE